MNFIAGVLLLFMGEQDVFWCLAAVVEDKLPGYFSVAMVAPQVDQLALNHLVAEQLPTLAALFAGHGIELTSVSMQWFLGVFVNSLPLETGLRVWDLLFLEQRRGGVPVVLFRVGMALLDVYQKVLQLETAWVICVFGGDGGHLRRGRGEGVGRAGAWFCNKERGEG